MPPRAGVELTYFLSPFLPADPSGHKRKLGLLGAKRTTITVHRSEEVLPRDVIIPTQPQSQQFYSGPSSVGGGGGGLGGGLVRQGTSVSSGEEFDEGGSERLAHSDDPGCTCNINPDQRSIWLDHEVERAERPVVVEQLLIRRFQILTSLWMFGCLPCLHTHTLVFEQSECT